MRDDDHYKKQVAIKVAAAGLSSPALLKRFGVERQILADLDHPNIARLLDGRATESGLPYVVMEFIDGRPIDDYCRERYPSARRKLELFVQVVRAVHSAHRKLVVHRDLKPGNILVSADGQPKLLDFGIAKLLDLRADATAPALTVESGRMMTPEYASPEQIRDEPITTATDVYQLGVVLYELLTGARPVAAGSSGRMSLEHDICERAPAKPGIDTDLDRVVMKAIEKEPDHRYASAAEFADDIDRYPGGFPVQARPVSWSYVTARFIRRHRFGFAAAALFAVLLAASVIGMAILTRRAQTEARTATRVTDFLLDLFSANDPSQGRGDQVTARELLDKGVPRLESSLKDEPEVQARLLDTMGAIYTRLGPYPQAKRVLRRSLEIREKALRRRDIALANTLSNLADLAGDRSELPQAEQLYREALRIFRAKLPDNDDNIAAALSNLSSVLFDEGRLKEAERLNREALARRERTLGLDSPETLITMNNLETVLAEEGQYANAEAIARQVLERRQRTESPSHPDLGYSWANLARTLQLLGRYPKAEDAARRALAIRLRAYREDHPEVQWSRMILAGILTDEGKPEEALPLARHATDGFLPTAGQNSTDTAYAEDGLGLALLDEGRARDARTYFVRPFDARSHALAPDSLTIAKSWLNLGRDDRELEN